MISGSNKGKCIKGKISIVAIRNNGMKQIGNAVMMSTKDNRKCTTSGVATEINGMKQIGDVANNNNTMMDDNGSRHHLRDKHRNILTKPSSTFPKAIIALRSQPIPK
jgi:hypothetical protein